jgi:hypothetical protein
MAETLSTVFRVDEPKETSRLGSVTRSFFSHETGHLLLHEQIKEKDFGLKLESVGINVMNSVEKQTMQVRPEVVRVPRAKKVSSTGKGNYILLKKYDGFITSRNGDSFTARLYEKAGDYPVLEAEFDLEELSEADRHLAIEGAALVWTIGYHDEDSRKRESLIYMRRRPGWDKKEIEQAKQATEELTRDIQWK